MSTINIVPYINNFVEWFGKVSRLLFTEIGINIGGVGISLGGLIVTAIMTSFVFSIFWKGAKQ